MQDFIGSVRRSLVFKSSGEESAGFGGFVEKIGSRFRISRIEIFSKPPAHALPPIATPPWIAVKAAPPMEEEPLLRMEEDAEDDRGIMRDRDDIILKSKTVNEEREKKEEDAFLSPIPSRKGEFIGCGAFGRVPMGMNLESGELLAVKEVAITANSASKKAQEYIRELAKEVNPLKNLLYPNIVFFLLLRDT